jgi:predicted ribosomally synthesized peptide with SipW-like signal peptide
LNGVFNVKINKKILVSLVLVGILSMIAGVGTYAAFTAKVKSVNNKIETVTYTINNKVGDQGFSLFTLNNGIPGSTATFAGFEAKATGNKEMDIIPQLNLIINKRSVDKDGVLTEPTRLNLDSEDANQFQIKTVVTFDGIQIFNSENGYKSMKEFMTAINSAGKKTLSQHETFTISNGEVRLNSAAGNDYQGATVDAELTLTADDLVVQ